MFFLSRSSIKEIVSMTKNMEIIGKKIRYLEIVILQIIDVCFDLDFNKNANYSCMLTLSDGLDSVRNVFLKKKDYINLVFSEKNILKGSLIILKCFSKLTYDKSWNEGNIYESISAIVLEKFYIIGHSDILRVPSNQIDLEFKNKENDRETINIAQLTLLHTGCEWIVRCLLCKIGDIKEYTNQSGKKNGILKRLLFRDKTGYLEAVVFDKDCDRDDIIEEKEYYIKSGCLRESNKHKKAWPNIDSINFDLYLSKYGKIEMLTYRELKFDFNINKTDHYQADSAREKYTRLNNLFVKHSNAYVNVIGVITEIEECRKVYYEKDEKIIINRNFFIKDISELKCRVTLWKDEAEKFNLRIGHIIILNDFKYKYYNGLTLSMVKNSSYIQAKETNTFEKVKEVREWWNNKRQKN